MSKTERVEATLVYVEDLDLERTQLSRFLGDHFSRVLPAASAQEAYALIEAHGADLVLCDVRMPQEDGLSLAKRIRARYPELPVVMLSAHNETEYLAEALRIGVRDFLFKPVELAHLLAVLNRILEESMLNKQYALLRLHNLEPQNLDEMVRLNRYFKPLADAAPIMAWVADAQGSAIFLNRSWQAFVGREAQALLDRGWLEDIHPEDRHAFDEAYTQALKQRLPFEAEYRLRRNDGTYRWVYDHGVPRFEEGRFEGMVGACIDITEVRWAREAHEAYARLQASQARYRALFETMLNGFALHELVFDDEGRPVDYRFLEVNPAFETMTGLRADRIVGHLVSEVLPDLEPTWLERYAHVALGGGRMVFEEYSRELDKHFFISAFSPAHGLFAVLMEDISERKRIQGALEEQTVELESLNRELMERVEREVKTRQESERAMLQQSRISMMGEMLSAIAHHWRQPLSAIALYIQGVREAFIYGELDRKTLDRAVNQSMALIQGMSKTIDELRGFLSQKEQSHACCALEEVKQVAQLLQPQLDEQRIALVGRCFGQPEKPLSDCVCAPNSRGWVQAYPAEFHQAIFNLLANARDAIMLRARRAPKGYRAQIAVGFLIRGDREEIWIEDNGGGFEEGALEHLFEPFFSTKERGQGVGVVTGVGLGLYLAKVIIEEQMGGTLTAEPIKGGARFKIVLPLTQAP